MLDFAGTVSAPRSLTLQELSRRLYPKAYQEGNLEMTLKAMHFVSREQSLLAEFPSPSITPQALERQQQALMLARGTVHARACALYFAKPGWTQRHLSQPGAQAKTWHFFATSDTRTHDSTSFWVGACSGIVVYGHAHIHALSVDQPTDDVYITPWQLSVGKRDVNLEFRGRADELAEWAFRNDVLHLCVKPSQPD